MIRKLKILGCALAAVFALAAVTSAAASAAEFHSESSTGDTILEGSQTTTNFFKVTNPKGTKVTEIFCPTARFAGTQAGNTASAVELHPTYAGGCSWGPIGSATVNTQGCNYNLHSAGTVDIVCSGTNKIKIEAPGCTIAVGSQSGLNGVSYTNSGTPGTVTVTSNVEGISYTSSGSLCSFDGVPSSGSLGDYTGAANIKGYVDTAGAKTAQTGIRWE